MAWPGAAPRRAGSGRCRRCPASRRVEVGPDGYDYEVRPVAAARATKTYRCPGCDHEIKPGIAHVVVWPADAGDQPSTTAGTGTRRAGQPGNRSPTRKWS